MSDEEINEETLRKIWNLIAKPEIDRAIEAGLKANKVIKLSKDEKQLEDFVISRWLTEYRELKRKAMLNPEYSMDRHKIAALFYIAFTDKINGFPFMVFDNSQKRELDADISVTHTIAFDISIGIIESYILSNSQTSVALKSYLQQNGLCDTPEKYRWNPTENYERQTVKQLIYASKENKISAALVANIFYNIENNSRLVFLLETNSEKP
jgi:hypothetical protein